jgi:hypothetical protein
MEPETNHLERFGQRVLAERALFLQLRATPDEPAFIELAVRLAAEAGCELDAATLRAAIREKRRAGLGPWI